MSNEERIQSLLARQKAKTEEAARQADLRRQKADEMELQKQQMNAIWQPMRKHLEEFVEGLNVEMSPNGVRLFVKALPAPDPEYIDRLEIALEPYVTRGSLKALFINVSNKGKVSVRMGTAYQMPAKEYDMQLEEMRTEHIERPALDFLELNT